MNKVILSLLVMGFVGVTLNSYAESADPCLKNVSKALTKLPGSGYSEADCTLSLQTNPMGAGFGVVGEADANCWNHISQVSVVHSITRWSVHFAPGSCRVLSISPISAPEPALEGTNDDDQN